MEALVQKIVEIIFPSVTLDQIYLISRDAPLLAFFASFIVVVFISTFLLKEGREAVRRLRSFKFTITNNVFAVFSAGLLIFLACIPLAIIRSAYQSKPIFDRDQQLDFLREPVVLKWHYKKERESENVVYTVQSSAERSFSQIDVDDVTQGETWYSYARGQKWWRVGVGSNPIRWGQPIQTRYFESSFERIRNDKRILVLVSNRITQGIFRYSNAGRFAGFDYEFSSAIAKRLSELFGRNVEAVFIPTSFDSILEGLGRGEGDLAVASITRRLARANKYHVKFSEPYFCTGQSLLSRMDDAAQGPLEDLLRSGITGVSSGSTGEELVKKLSGEKQDDLKNEIKFREYNQIEDMVVSLLTPKSNLRFGVTDTVFATERLLQKDAVNIKQREILPQEYPGSTLERERGDSYSAATYESETELIKIVNDVVERLRAKDSSGRSKIDTMLEEALKKKYPLLSQNKIKEIYRSRCIGPS